MKKFGRKLAIVLVMMMIFTSFEFVGVFADDTPGSEPVATEESGNGDIDAPAPAAASEEGTVNEETPSAKAPLRDGEATDDALADALAIEDLKLVSGNGCVVLRWRAIDIPGVEYSVYEYNASTGEYDPVTASIGDYDYVKDNPRNGLSGDYKMCEFKKGVSEGVGLSAYRYKVQAKVGDSEGTISDPSNWAAPVRTIAYKFTVKRGTKLKKHGGSGPSTYTLRKGQTLICYGFGGGGCYMFKHNGSIFYCAKIRVKKPKAIYVTGWNYTPEEAELYVKQKGTHGNRDVFLWVSQYTQHLFYMEKVKEGPSKGRWKCSDDWECSTGKPSAPSPTGMYGIKKIEGKWAKHHNIKWWSKFSGTNSVHGQKPKWTFGAPKSNGCVRNPVAKAQKVYYGAAVGAGLLMY